MFVLYVQSRFSLYELWRISNSLQPPRCPERRLHGRKGGTKRFQRSVGNRTLLLLNNSKSLSSWSKREDEILAKYLQRFSKLLATSLPASMLLSWPASRPLLLLATRYVGSYHRLPVSLSNLNVSLPLIYFSRKISVQYQSSSRIHTS
jgi:hypothetical protein